MPPKKKAPLPPKSEPQTTKSSSQSTIGAKSTRDVKREPVKAELTTSAITTKKSIAQKTTTKQAKVEPKQEVRVANMIETDSDSDDTSPIKTTTKNTQLTTRKKNTRTTKTKSTSSMNDDSDDSDDSHQDDSIKMDIDDHDDDDDDDNNGSVGDLVKKIVMEEQQTTISQLMATQRQPKIQNKLEDWANIELDLDLDEVDQLANHFGDLFITIGFDKQSEQITRSLSQIKNDKNSAYYVLSEYNAEYQKQNFNGFAAGKQDLEAAMGLEMKSKSDMNLAINSTMLSQSSSKDHSKSIDDIVSKIDLVAEHFGNRYENEEAVKRKIAKKRQKQTSGKMWFDLPKTKMTKQAMQTWAILQHKGQLIDNKGQFLRVEKSKLPEYSQIGTFVGGGAQQDGSLSKKEKKRSLAEQFLDDMKSTTTVRQRFKAYAQRRQEQWGTGTQYSGIKRKYKKK